jgi:hypothetical protein
VAEALLQNGRQAYALQGGFEEWVEVGETEPLAQTAPGGRFYVR